MTYAETGRAIDELAVGLIDLGISPGDRVCLLSDTRVEWTLVSYAISAAGAVVVPIYPTSSARECKWVAGNSRARAVVCENAGQRDKIDQVRDALPELEHVIGVEAGGGDLTLQTLRAGGGERSELSARREAVGRQDAYTIIYTSGTTGPPKGVVLTHANAMSVCEMVEEIKFVQPGAVLEGWGMSETVAVGTVATLEQFKFGTVGRPLPGVEIRIAPRDGEILMRGPNVFREYWDNPKATAETLVEGWLHTGDVGELDDQGYLKITGRKKDIIITAGGKNLTPSTIENELKQSRYISHASMHGDRRPYPVALITLDEEEIVPWALEHGLLDKIPQLAASDVVRELVQRELDRANANYASAEQIKKFAILDHDLSVEQGELTPTLKVKRSVVNDRYAGLFEDMYG